MWNLFRWHSRSYLTYLICKSYALYYLIISTFIYILIFGILLGCSWESWQIIFVSCFLYFTFLCYVTVIWIYLVYTRLKTTCKKHILIKKSHSRNNVNFKKKKKKRNTNSEFLQKPWNVFSFDLNWFQFPKQKIMSRHCLLNWDVYMTALQLCKLLSEPLERLWQQQQEQQQQ